MTMKKYNYSFMTIIALIMSIISFSSCKKRSFDELNAEHKAKKSAIEKKLTKKYCYDVTKTALGQKFSRIDTIIITKYSTHANNVGKWDEVSYPSAYIRTDGKVKGIINNQEGTFSYWFETNIKTENIDAKIFDVESMFAKDQDGDYVIAKNGINDDSAEQLKEKKKKSQVDREYAKTLEITIDGIKVSYLSKDDSDGYTVLNYFSDKKLSDNQIRKVGKKIKLKYFYVMFSAKGDNDYAYYLYGEDVIKHRNPNNRHLYN